MAQSPPLSHWATLSQVLTEAAFATCVPVNGRIRADAAATRAATPPRFERNDGIQDTDMSAFSSSVRGRDTPSCRQGPPGWGRAAWGGWLPAAGELAGGAE